MNHPKTDLWSEISVGIVMHNAADHITRTIRNVIEAGCPAARIILADVASTDNSREVVAGIDNDIRIECLSENRGPNPARNRLMNVCPAKFLLLMDSDVIIERTAIQKMWDEIGTHDSYAIASPLVVHDATPAHVQYGGSWLHFICESVNRSEGKLPSQLSRHPAPIGVASGNALLMNLQRLEPVGGFDESLFMAKEDGDYTFRVCIAGLTILEVPQAVVRHISNSRDSRLYYYQLRNRWIFMLKNYETRTLLVTAPVLIVHELMQLVLMVALGHGVTYLRALGGFLRLFKPTLASRAAVRQTRVVHDSQILVADPFVISKSIMRYRFLHRLKSGYDRCLRWYWIVACKVFLRA